MSAQRKARRVSFRNYALEHVKTCCFSKVIIKKHDLLVKYGAFKYKGKDFIPPWHLGLVPDCDVQKLGHDLEQVEHIWFIETEWKKLEHSLIQWLNQCSNLTDISLLLPEIVTQHFTVNITGDRTVSDDWLEMVQNTPEYTMLETLMFTNEILEQ